MNNIMIKILLIIILAIIVLFNIYKHLLFPCNKNTISIIFSIASIIIFAFLSNELFKLFKLHYEKTFFVGLLTIILLIISIAREKKHYSLLIKNNGGIIRPAIVTKKHDSYKSSPTIYYDYKTDDNLCSGQYSVVKESKYGLAMEDDNLYNKININDTVLIIHPIFCPIKSFLFKMFPTPQEIDRCKDGCLYKDGEIVGEAK
jgi:hypothetical protein